MNGPQVREARRQRGWNQQELARQLDVSQGYVSLMERGRRSVPQHLAPKLVSLLRLPASELPVRTATPLPADRVAGALSSFGYLAFKHLHRGLRKNPAEVLVSALLPETVEARLVEALPWLVTKFPALDWDWVVSQAKLHDVQNRLGFVVTLAKRLAQMRGESNTAEALGKLESVLERARLQREDAFGALTEAERRWLQTNRSPEAKQWNLLTSLNAESLRYAA
jgi:transcriptional regulator with XRE-family HTH domain